MTLLYDGTFEGLLTGLYWSYHYKTQVLVDGTRYQTQLFESTQVIATDPNLASKMAFRIRNKFGEPTMEKILYAFLSEDMEVGKKVRVFLDYAVHAPAGAIQDYSHPAVFPLLKLARAVQRESHLFVGLIRFEYLASGIYYASFSPTYDLLNILVPHFEKRLSDQSWVIHDVKRGLAAFYNQTNTWTAPLTQDIEKALHSQETDFKKMWQKYYNHIGIKERYNPNLRRSFMPKKYWKHLTEFQSLDAISNELTQSQSGKNKSNH